jgi:hypothetical protein
MKERIEWTRARMAAKALEMSRFWTDCAKGSIYRSKRFASQGDNWDDDGAYLAAKNAASRANDAIRFVEKWINEEAA